jgi:predicted alpha-1,6-mannanase (GH76 family)
MKKTYFEQPPAVSVLLQCLIAITLLFTACSKPKSDELKLAEPIGLNKGLTIKSSFAGMTPTNPMSNADAAYNGFISAYLITSGAGTPYFCQSLTNRNRAFFWQQCYLITTVEDAYDRNPTTSRQQLISDLLTKELAQDLTNWSWDSWNDDAEWGMIACIRGYLITGNTAFRDAAKNNFDMCYNRGWDSTYGGGIWEDQNQVPNGGKCGLSNWPLIIAGSMIYQATGDVNYLNKSEAVYAWARTHCYDASSGRVYEGFYPSGIGGDDNSYNSGLLINAAASLYKITNNATYYNDAITAANHYIGRIGGLSTGIMNEDHPANGYFGSDQVARGLAKLAKENNLWSTYGPFLANNSNAAWNHRRTDYNFTWNNFSSNTTTGDVFAMEVQSSVTDQMVTPEQGLSIPNGTYKIINRQNGNALDAKANGTANGTVIDSWAYNSGNNQRWTITSIGNGLYKLIGVGSGRSLNVSGASTANGGAVVLWDFQNTPNEVFYLSSPASGYYSLIFSHSNRALDLNTTTNTTDQWEQNGGNNQQWQFQAP